MQPFDLDIKAVMPSPSRAISPKSMATSQASNSRSNDTQAPPQYLSNSKQFLSNNNTRSQGSVFETIIRGEKNKVNISEVDDKLPTVEQLNELTSNATPLQSEQREDSSSTLDSKGSGSHQENGGDNGISEEQQLGFLPVLRNSNFLSLWSGQVFSQLADKVYLVLMIALISSRYQVGNQSISGWVSAIMMAFTIPAVLFGSIAGVFVDRWSKRQCW